MPDRGRTHGRGAGPLIHRTPLARPGPADASPGHDWLMRRDLTGPVANAQWPANIVCAPFAEHLTLPAHSLLVLGYQDGAGSVQDYPAWLAAFEQDPEFEQSLCFLAMHDHRVVGVITCWTSAFIKDLVVHPDYRNRGIGGALLEHLFAHLRQRGEGAVDLKVMENNLTARRLYEKSGMSYVARSTAAQD